MDPSVIVGMFGAGISAMFGLYTQELRRQITKLEKELKETNDKVEETVKAGNEATRRELAELRKTNAELVAALLAARGGPS